MQWPPVGQNPIGGHSDLWRYEPKDVPARKMLISLRQGLLLGSGLGLGSNGLVGLGVLLGLLL